MRQRIFCGLVITITFAALGAAGAQQTGQSPIEFGSTLSQIGDPVNRNTAFGRHDQSSTADAVRPPVLTNPIPPVPPAFNAAPATIRQDADKEQAAPAPATPVAAAPQTPCGCSDCGANGDYSYGDYFNNGRDRHLGGHDHNANWVFGARGLVMRRDYEDDKSLSYDPADPTNVFATSTSVKMGSMNGYEVFLSRRNCNGRGFEARYWELNPGVNDYTLANSPNTALSGFNQVDFGAQSVYSIYNASDSHSFYRENQFNNLELNLLRLAGSNNCCGSSWEWLAGFRWFRFDESFRYATYTANAAYPPQLFYDTRVNNNLYGFQVGGRTERCLCKGWGLQFDSKVGIFGNHLDHQQSISDGNGTFAVINSGPYAGQDYAFSSNKNDFSMMGQIDLGLYYQFSSCWRAVGGYQLLGISGVGLAPDQIPYNFTDSRDIQRIKSNGSLILHGAYFGVEHSF